MTDLSLVQWVIYHSFGGSGIDGPDTEKIVVVDKRKYDEIASAYESIKNKLHQHEHGMRNCMSCGSSGEDVKKTETAYICKCGYSWMTLQQVHEAEINEERAKSAKLAALLQENLDWPPGVPTRIYDAWENRVRAALSESPTERVKPIEEHSMEALVTMGRSTIKSGDRNE